MISAGELGRIKYIYSSRLNLGKLRAEENILWSFAPHDIAAVLYLLEEMPTRVASRGWHLRRLARRGYHAEHLPVCQWC